MKYLKKFNETNESVEFTILSAVILHDIYKLFKNYRLSERLSNFDSILEVLNSIVDIDKAEFSEDDKSINLKITGYSFGKEVPSDVLDMKKYKSSKFDSILRKVFDANEILINIDKESKKLDIKFFNKNSLVFDSDLSNELVLSDYEIKELSNLFKKYR